MLKETIIREAVKQGIIKREGVPSVNLERNVVDAIVEINIRDDSSSDE